MTWREEIKNGYPWKPLVFVAVIAIVILATLYGMLVKNPAERAVIDHGTRTTGHAVAYQSSTRRDSVYTWDANLTWFDAQGRQHEQRGLGISEREAKAIGVGGNGKDVEIQYIGDEAVIVDDIQYRVRDESNAPVLLALFSIVALLGLYHWRRRLREWRAPKPAQW